MEDILLGSQYGSRLKKYLKVAQTRNNQYFGLPKTYMRALTYINTKTTIPGWVETIHIDNPRGYAYETPTHFVHMYGRNHGLYVISIGLTAIQKKEGTLEDWIVNTFGATEIESLTLEVGYAVEGVWRPCLYYWGDSYQALNTTETEMRLAEQSLRLLIDKLDDLFFFIEPDIQCLDTYSHKTRELLILACTEVESSWKFQMKIASAQPINKRDYTTKDYVKLVDRLHLKEYQFKLKSYKDIPPFSPFKQWSTANPSASLDWYDAYNKTKHDRASYFSKATLRNCISAVVANLIMHCIRFSPFPMFDDGNPFSARVTQHFGAELIDCSPTSFYLHDITIAPDTRDDLFIFDPREKGWASPFKKATLNI